MIRQVKEWGRGQRRQSLAGGDMVQLAEGGWREEAGGVGRSQSTGVGILFMELLQDFK